MGDRAFETYRDDIVSLFRCRCHYEWSPRSQRRLRLGSNSGRLWMGDEYRLRCTLRRGMGPAHTASPHAYRSESYGLLSLLCFLRRLAEFTEKHDHASLLATAGIQ